jgi:hypothetical protein
MRCIKTRRFAQPDSNSGDAGQARPRVRFRICRRTWRQFVLSLVLAVRPKPMVHVRLGDSECLPDKPRACWTTVRPAAVVSMLPSASRVGALQDCKEHLQYPISLTGPNGKRILHHFSDQQHM